MFSMIILNVNGIFKNDYVTCYSVKSTCWEWELFGKNIAIVLHCKTFEICHK